VMHTASNGLGNKDDVERLYNCKCWKQIADRTCRGEASLALFQAAF
jgi:hypothetical protein